MGLEWIDDNTCVLVFESKAAARQGHNFLAKSPTEEPDTDGFLTAKPIPITLWPPEERINKSLGKGEGLKGTVRMRWARHADVKKKGAKRESNFYKKHGARAGKEGFFSPPPESGPPKKRRRDSEKGEDELRAELDNDLDEFLAEDEPERAPSHPSKMRSERMVNEKRSLLERTSVMRAQTVSLVDRITKPLPRRRDGGGGTREWDRGKDSEVSLPRRRRSADRTRSERRERPQKKTQQELDDELDAFWNEGR
ncbi:hypothetical protein NEOLEDRAFT_1140494 [Neolentinus lepideus HHB14362 ss-1]|uniref:Chromatin target of PRMT1 protein C-terminal domain-containing protein n=1 Tax=Neolentinus lepideus HHB14362 ss-1 TaxID=1314782 RepID=A0A165P866_9AGAM|nr:hypothetical protein NEOLEDRAFT_1140494 [Neolentinus lepideus HHB14362 ss-1]